MNGGEDSGGLLVMNECSGHREITPRGAKPCRLLLTLNLLLIFFGSRHCICAYKSWFKEGWREIFLFICLCLFYFILQTS